eukprot:TRINITY_DN114972_c0_g1_i1.p1 TRINITY_DN114972_c0_g1~~TRINITY_DN114972_c0_g1_i1.p1  ORF type:complete len:208 (+),score=62.13 TRINITY_DN114972_c0_g1_i1:111-734(+)
MALLQGAAAFCSGGSCPGAAAPRAAAGAISTSLSAAPLTPAAPPAADSWVAAGVAFAVALGARQTRQSRQRRGSALQRSAALRDPDGNKIPWEDMSKMDKAALLGQVDTNAPLRLILIAVGALIIIKNFLDGFLMVFKTKVGIYGWKIDDGALVVDAVFIAIGAAMVWAAYNVFVPPDLEQVVKEDLAKAPEAEAEEEKKKLAEPGQ